MAKNNQVRTFRAPAPRGSILDRNGTVLVSNRPGTAVQLWPAAFDQATPERQVFVMRRLATLLNIPFREIKTDLAARKDDFLTPITIKENVNEEKINYLLEHQNDFPGVQINQTYQRHYDQGGIAAQTLGFVSEISQQQLDAAKGKGYAAGDRIGQTGVEAGYDTYLRGLPGIGRVYVDALGRVTSARQFQQLPEAGDNVRLTLDAGLQQTAEDALDFGIRLAHEDGQWAADGGALVAMDPNTGEILALASNPTFNPGIYTGRVEKSELKKLSDPAANHPTLDRAVSGLYPPGSTFKPVTALAALETGLLSPDELIQCTPKEVVDGQTFTNWDPYANEPMKLTTALAASCDTYFYQVALRFYNRTDSPLQRWAHTMGFGASTGIDVGPEASGLIPTPAWRRHYFKTEIDKIWTSGDSVQLGIGQGDVLVTPLQMTRFYAMLANGGKLVEPHIVQSVEEPSTQGQPPVVLRPYSPKPPKDVGLNPEQHPRRPGRALRRDARELRHVVGHLRLVPHRDRGQDRHGREIRAPSRLPGTAGPGLVVRLRAVREALARRLRDDRERRPWRRRRGSGRAAGLPEVLQGRSELVQRPGGQQRLMATIAREAPRREGARRLRGRGIPPPPRLPAHRRRRRSDRVRDLGAHRRDAKRRARRRELLRLAAGGLHRRRRDPRRRGDRDEPGCLPPLGQGASTCSRSRCFSSCSSSGTMSAAPSGGSSSALFASSRRSSARCCSSSSSPRSSPTAFGATRAGAPSGVRSGSRPCRWHLSSRSPTSARR